MPNIKLNRPFNGKKLFIILLPSLLLFSRVFADVTVILTALAFIWYSQKIRNWEWLKSGWIRLSIITCIYLITISTPLGHNPGQSLLHSIAYIRWPLFAAALAFWILADKNSLDLFGKAMAITVLFIIFDTFWQFVNGVDIFGVEKHSPRRLTGPMRKPIPGNMTLRVFFIALYSIFLLKINQNSTRKFSLLLFFLLIGILFVYSTGERMSFALSLASTSFVLIGLYFQYPNHRKLLSLWVLGGLLSIAIYSYLNPQVYNRSVLAMIQSLSSFKEDAYGRVFITGYEVWKTHPITGVGRFNYASACPELINIKEFDSCQRHPHNIYIHWLAETGIIGTLLFIATILAIFRQSIIKTLAEKQWLLSSCVIATLFVSLWPISSSASFFSNWLGAIIWCTIGWSLAVSNHIPNELNKH